MSLLLGCAYVPEMLLRAPKEIEQHDLHALLASSKGVAFIKVYRIGCIVTIRGGKGVLLRKLDLGDLSKEDGGDDGSSKNGDRVEWSAPCALSFAGPSLGASIGLERSNYIIFLKTEQDIISFSSGTMAMGLNGTGAIGPVGRSGEALIAPGTKGALVWADSSGLYGGVSLEFTGIFVDNVANQAQYGMGIQASDILSGRVPKPTGEVFERMYESLHQHSLMPDHQWANAQKAAQFQNGNGNGNGLDNNETDLNGGPNFHAGTGFDAQGENTANGAGFQAGVGIPQGPDFQNGAGFGAESPVVVKGGVQQRAKVDN